MVDAIVADLASGLVLKLVSLATEEVILAWNLHEDLEALRERLESIDALLSDADSKKLTISAVQNWFNKLQDVANVANVFMDELAYQVTRRKVKNHGKLQDFLIPSKNSILYRIKMAHKIKSIHTSCDKIFKWAGDLGLQPVAHINSIVQPREIRRTPPFEDESLIVGRENDISFLLQCVCKNYDEDLAVIVVVGMGGQGKTTLSRMLYNSDVVINMFRKRMWITVSENFDFTEILNQMVVSLTSNPSMLKSTEGLINNLKTNLKGEKFLLVLDDVWNEKPEEWDKLRNSLLAVGGARGSLILVTTRNQEVIDSIRCSVSHRVEKLSEEDSWELFKKITFSQGGVVKTKAFTALGRNMVKRCGGLPLAIKTLGGLLRSNKYEKEWLLIQNSEIWKSKGVLPSLRLSYDNLPYSSLRRCFAYCSIMPKDSVIYKNELIHIWMALGFLLPPKGSNVLMEDTGDEYFNILLWNSLLQDVERDEFGNIITCKMHDLVHDLAQERSKHHYVTLKAGQELDHISKPIYVRLNIGVSNVKPTTLKRNFERVQVLYAKARILGGALPYFKHLTVLVLNTNEVTEELPSSLSKMKYLKHLDISCFCSRLPSYITELCNLQTLRVWKLDEVPKKFCNLINLRHLFIKMAYAKTRCVFVGIEKLTCMQTLPHFAVSRVQNCLVGQLGGLKYLRGKLELYGLGDIYNMEEASKASLCTKTNIERLKLEWNKNEDKVENREYNDEDVMIGLKPHANLKELTIVHFKGQKFASWITMMTNLVKITLKSCNRCEKFPPLGHLPQLVEMEINGMDSVKLIGNDICGGLGTRSELCESGAAKKVTTMYPSLTKLILRGLPKLEEWIEPDSEDQGNLLVFPKLEVLEIVSCPKLTGIPSSCFLSLKKLEIIDLDSSMILEIMSKKLSSLVNLRLLNIKDEGRVTTSIIKDLLKNNSLSLTSFNLNNCKGLTCLAIGIALEKLQVSNCPHLTSIDVLEKSGALQNLMIVRCPKYGVFSQCLSSTIVNLKLGPFSEESDEFPWPFSASCLISFPNLIELQLWGSEKVKSIIPAGQLDDHLSSAFPALTELDIFDFEGVEALPGALSKLPSLKTLYILNCVNLKSLPTFDKSDSLQCLEISDCPILKERCRKDTGTEWFKIQHIPRVICWV